MRSLKNELSDRVLRFDGVSEIQPDTLAHFLLLGVPPSQLRVTAETEDVASFNAQVREDEQVQLVRAEPISLDLSWNIPEKYLNLDIQEYVLDAFFKKGLEYNEAQLEAAGRRIEAELHQIQVRGMVEFIQTIIYILDVLKREKVIWGVGRGSSCASYVLFILGLHVVDCVLLDVPMEEFFH